MLLGRTIDLTTYSIGGDIYDHEDYIEVYREVNPEATLLDHWTTRIERSQTHYVHSIIYGGWSAILYRFRCEIPGDEEVVRQILTSFMGTSGNMDDHTVELLKNAVKKVQESKDLNGKVDIHIQVYSSVPHSEDVTSPESLLKVIEKLPEDVGEVGQPLFVELKPLNKLNSNYPKAKADHESERFMIELDEMFDDLRFAKNGLRKWMMETTAEFTEEEEKKITKILDHVNQCIHLFHKIAGEASIYKPLDQNLFQSAIRKYNRGVEGEADSYSQMYLQLKEDLEPNCVDDFVHKIKGVLEVTHDESVDAGRVKGGLEECKKICFEEPKCRAIGFAENLLVIVGAPTGLQLVNKKNQCKIYTRSSRTAKIISPKGRGSFFIYDRKCN
ncbi:uncharacterized protein TNIN_308051 [Trichonephila inaurata madagascariensis]|uniref:Apple domain-containing protein n=1 Tax=Trichonephila inaurata madagascariensis TaxID=2747483 RepID=A0A8X7BNY4_9ARAC|nr:uncharacterized protein TNIN_308051 [Trichonephila inaurata madagascariensis]